MPTSLAPPRGSHRDRLRGQQSLAGAVNATALDKPQHLVDPRSVPDEGRGGSPPPIVWGVEPGAHGLETESCPPSQRGRFDDAEYRTSFQGFVRRAGMRSTDPRTSRSRSAPTSRTSAHPVMRALSMLRPNPADPRRRRARRHDRAAG